MRGPSDRGWCLLRVLAFLAGLLAGSVSVARGQAATFPAHWVDREEVANGLAASALGSGLASKQPAWVRLAVFTAVSTSYEVFIDPYHQDWFGQARRDVCGRAVGYVAGELLTALWRTLR